MSISRRRFFSRLTACAVTTPFAASALVAGEQYIPHPGDLSTGAVFRHGVASGDPLADRVILWTRISPRIPGVPVPFGWKIATDSRMQNILAAGQGLASPLRDYTVKLDPSGLSPDTTYYYQFYAFNEASAIGRTRTLPVGSVEQIRLAVCSCSNYAYGFFSVYGHIARRVDLNAVVHLGDYLYEYENATFGDGETIGRAPLPNAETLTVHDYRMRHAQYKTDLHLKECHRQHPFICVWDDHETAKDAYRDGAENHDPGEGSWQARKAQALRAYFEWMPIREQSQLLTPAENIFRQFRFGDVADLLMLETRLAARSKQVQSVIDPFTQQLLLDDPVNELPAILAELYDPARELLGQTQRAWLYQQMLASAEQEVSWRLLGQQTMMGQLKLLVPFLAGAEFDGYFAINHDQWDGYEAERYRLLHFIEQNGIDNVCVLTGDIHSSWAQDIAKNPFDDSYDGVTGSGALAVEFVTPAVTSEGIPEPAASAFEPLLLAAPHLHYVDLSARGYMVLSVTHTHAQADWFHIDNVLDPVSSENFAAAFRANSGTAHVVAVNTPVLAGAEREPAPEMGQNGPAVV